MALDKQRILNDLGNVMNQLQSADCGCMGKLFSNPGHQQQGMGNTGMGGQPCGNYCWRNQGYGRPCSGEPYSMNQQAMPMQGRPCMGHCNPPKLYADTYSYLNQNLMQPVVREVYDDLKGICPANAIMNDALGAQMGLAQNSPTSPVVRGNMGQVVGQNPMGDAIGAQNAMQSMGGMPAGHSMNNMAMGEQQQQNPMGGMGAEIVNMMMKSNKSQPGVAGQVGQQPMQGSGMPPQMGVNQGSYSGNMEGIGRNHTQPVGGIDPNNAVQYNMNVNQNLYNAAHTPIIPEDQYANGNMVGHQAHYYTGNTGMTNMYQGNAVSEIQNSSPQYMNQHYTAGNAQVNAMPNMTGNMNPNQQMVNMQANQGGQQMPADSRNYGQHTQGVAKFNEMFPGVMQGLGGNLDFDPMAIAIQMNPANKQRATMDTMQKLMSEKGGNRALDAKSTEMKPVMNGMKAVTANFNSHQAQLAQETPNQQHYNPEAAVNQPNQMQQQQIVNTAVTDAQMNQQLLHQQMLQQQVSQHQQPQQVFEQNYQEQLQTHPNRSGNVGLPGGGYPNQIPAPQQTIKDPIYPVDTSRQQSSMGGQKLQYNTLGQPIETLSPTSYRYKEPGLPQTLSPQPVPSRLRNETTKYSNVKSTISKTSLFGNRTAGKTPSRAQLQQVYNQYKGSHSYTNQNVHNTRHAPQGRQVTASDGHLNVNQPNAIPKLHVPVEKVGGDTIANNQVPNAQVAEVKGDNNINQHGDFAANKPKGDADQVAPPAKNARLRNGLQDMVFTSYPQSASWTFHGHPNRNPYPAYGSRV